MKIFESLVARIAVALALLCPALSSGQADAAPADMRVVVLKTQSSTLSFEQYATVESVPANAPLSSLPASGNETLRSIASDGDQWFSITRPKEGLQNPGLTRVA